MIYLRKAMERATEAAARDDYRRGYAHGVADLSPPNPDDLSPAYWTGYGRGQRDARIWNPGRPGGADDSLGE